jgi:ABC-type phosphate transport system substrate-binding protein
MWDGGHNYCILDAPTAEIFYDCTVPLNVWYTVRIECLNNNIKVYISPKGSGQFTKVVDYSDTVGSSLIGSVGFNPWSGDACIYGEHYDNVLVTSWP